ARSAVGRIDGRSRDAHPALEEQSTGAVRAGAGGDVRRCCRSPLEAVSPPVASGSWTLLCDGASAGNGRVAQWPSLRRVRSPLQTRRAGCVELAGQPRLPPPGPRLRQRNQPVVLRRVLQPALRGLPCGWWTYAAWRNRAVRALVHARAPSPVSVMTTPAVRRIL